MPNNSYVYPRTDWWLERSVTPEYQKAYNRTASFPAGLIKRSYLVADMGCGNGHLVSRLYNITHRVVGVDADERMLLEAFELLRSRQIPVKILLGEQQTQPQMPENGVLLVQGNILKPNLPRGIFRHIFYTFHDLKSYGAGIIVAGFGSPPSHGEVGILYEYALRRTFAELLERQGHVTECIYDADFPNQTQLLSYFIRLAYPDFILVKKQFFKEPLIGSDTLDARQEFRNEMNGYSVFTVKKK